MGPETRSQLADIRDNAAAYRGELTARDNGVITAELEKLADLADVLHVRFGHLEDLLTGVLSPFSEIKAEAVHDPAPSQSPVAERLASLRQRLEGLAYRIDGTTGRVEL